LAFGVIQNISAFWGLSRGKLSASRSSTFIVRWVESLPITDPASLNISFTY
jgi:hypothetical protein